MKRCGEMEMDRDGERQKGTERLREREQSEREEIMREMGSERG